MTPYCLSCNSIRRISCLGPAASTAKSRRVGQQQHRESSSTVQYLPWHQNDDCKSKDDAFHHKFVGMMMLRQVLKNYAREEFNLIHFFDGVKLAVQNLCESVKSQDKEGHMTSMLGPDLHNKFRTAFNEMKISKERIVLEVESIKNLRVAGIRTICGTAEPNDQYIINFLGQKIITSKRDMFELEKRGDSSGYSALFQYGKKLGISAAEKELRFQIDVKFFTKERFYIERKRDDGWLMMVGGLDLVSRAHKLRFESTLQDPNENYPLAWKIADIDFEDRSDNIYDDDGDDST